MVRTCVVGGLVMEEGGRGVGSANVAHCSCMEVVRKVLAGEVRGEGDRKEEATSIHKEKRRP